MIPILVQLGLWGIIGWLKLAGGPSSIHSSGGEVMISVLFVLWCFMLPLQFRRRHE